MYYVAGSNVFIQWLPADTIFPEFRKLSKTICHFPVAKAKLIFMHWSYNIFVVDNTFYITGALYGKENIRILNLPEDCDASNTLIAGNDYKLVVVHKSTCTVWVINLENMNEMEKLNLNIEQPLEDASKKNKFEDCVIKMSLMNDSCLYLTERGYVYSGILPSYMDTRHCIGKVYDIACGYEHFMILTDAGYVYTWGEGGRLQLGHGDLIFQDSPILVDALAGIKIVKIQAGGWHSLALSESGDVYAWGWNDTGQLGIDESKTRRNMLLPIVIDLHNNEANLNIKDIACGSKHSAILLEDNTVWATGYNKYGQLGLSPEKYPTVKKFRKVCQLKNDVELRCGPWNSVLISD